MVNQSYAIEVEDVKDLDVVSCLSLVASALAERAADRLAAAGHEGLRPSDGRLVARLLEGPQPVSRLAAALGVTPQAVSKLVRPLADADYVTVAPGEDARVRVVALAPRGRAAVLAAREAREAVAAELDAELGGRLEACRPALLAAMAALGMGDVAAARRAV